MQPYGNYQSPNGRQVCSECGARFNPYRRTIFTRAPAVCSTSCQRARKTRLQRELRKARKPVTLPQRGVVR